MEFILTYLKETYLLLKEMAPYLLLGFLIAGILKYGFRQRHVRRWLGKANARSVINASLLGVPMPLCSCGVIPTGIGLHRNGASKGSALSFLISTPQTGVDSILVTYSLLGLPFAIIRPIVAFLTGISGGLLSNKVEKNEHSYHEKQSEEELPKGWKRIPAILKYAYLDFMQDIAKWLIIGILAAGLISALVPDDFFLNYLNDPYLSMLIMLVVSVPLYVCATGSVPIAAVLLAKGLSPGAALVFLMAGPATNAATMAVIGKTLGKKSLIVYLAAIIGGSFLAGTVMNEFLPASWFVPAMLSGHHHSAMPDWFFTVSAIILSGLLLLAIVRQRTVSSQICKSEVPMSSIVNIKIDGMSCNHCVMAVKKALTSLDNVGEVEVNLSRGSATITGEVDLKEIEKVINQLGYTYKGVE